MIGYTMNEFDRQETTIRACMLKDKARETRLNMIKLIYIDKTNKIKKGKAR